MNKGLDAFHRARVQLDNQTRPYRYIKITRVTAMLLLLGSFGALRDALHASFEDSHEK